MTTLNQRLLQQGERIRVMVVDDSVVIRRMVSQALEHDPMLQVVGVASNGTIGLQRIPLLNPDVIILDIEMPEMNGLEMLRRIRQNYPQTRVIMFSTLTERGAAITFEALAAGANDYVTKPTSEGSIGGSVTRLQAEMIPKVRQFFRLPGESASTNSAAAESASTKPAAWQSKVNMPLRKVPPKVLVIGVSTGGPTALGEILPKVPATFPLPIMIVQHMPPLFTRLLAERLNSACQLKVAEATDGGLVETGKMLIAPGDFHMKVVAGGGRPCISLDQSPLQNFCRPAVDALFTSSAEVFGGAVLAVILTGMGQDGLRGAGILRAQGASVLAQDETSSVVWGMPGAVVNAGLADRVLPLGEVVPEILRLAGMVQE